MEKKKLVVNAALCDARTVSESTLEAYESIVINSAVILVSKESNELIARYNVSMNTSEVMEVSAEAELMVQNGAYEITGGTVMAKPTVLVVNGSLNIGKDSGKALESFISIIVNGQLSYPSDLKEQLPPIKVNGSTDSYPGDAIKLKNKLVLDLPFIIKAKKAKYFVKNKVIVTDEALDISRLTDKGASFITKNAVIAENLLEKAMLLFGEETNIKVVPAGYACCADGELNDALIRKHGDKLFIDGDLIIDSESRNALEKLSSVKVSGSVLITEKLTEKFNTLDAEYEKLKFIKGKILSDKGITSVEKRMLEKQEDGITVIDCGLVNVKEEIKPEEIEEKLQFIDCGCVFCYPEQKGSIELVSEGVGLISDSGAKGAGSLKGILGELKLFDKDTKVINASSYKM
ncbi:MAG: hypothetical protein PHV32_04945 [Eubacteriales bacterium]|nr:hypothetical protein [Eubacteriales bacterium]